MARKFNWEQPLAASTPKLVSAGCPGAWVDAFLSVGHGHFLFVLLLVIYLISSLILNKKEGYRRPPSETYRIKPTGNGLLFRENHTQARPQAHVTEGGKLSHQVWPWQVRCWEDLGGSQLEIHWTPPPPTFTRIRIWPLTLTSSMGGGIQNSQAQHLCSC